MQSSSLKVLIVEDHEESAWSLAHLLGLDGHSVQVVPDVRSAFQAVVNDQPDVAFIDIGLPGGLDGYEVVRALREPRDGRRPLLVVLTGSSGEEVRARSRREGIDLHLTKPVEPEALRGILRRFAEILSPAEPGGEAGYTL
jgi:CheY-like chemotaxis protein